MKKTLKVLSLMMIALLCVSSVFAKSKKSKKAKEAPKVTVNSDMLDGFEDGMYWRAVGTSWGDGDISTDAAISSEWKTEGKNSLKCTFKQTGSNGGCATFMTESPAIVDVSPYEAMIVDVNNPFNVPIKVAFSLSTGAGWEWYEGPCFELKPGENKNLKTEFFTNTLKGAPSNWQFTANLADSDDVRRVAAKFILPANIEGSVFIDNIRLQ